MGLEHCKTVAAFDYGVRAMDREQSITAEEFLRLHGYRKCDIAACNCGSWHGGHANQRLAEIREAFEQDELTDTRHKTLLNLVCEVLTDRADLRLRVEQAEYNLSSALEQRDRANDMRRMAESERDSALAAGREGWNQFYALRKQMAEQRHPNLTNEVKAND